MTTHRADQSLPCPRPERVRHRSKARLRRPSVDKKRVPVSGDPRTLVVSEAGLEPARPFSQSLAPQASASANSATPTCALNARSILSHSRTVASTNCKFFSPARTTRAEAENPPPARETPPPGSPERRRPPKPRMREALPYFAQPMLSLETVRNRQGP